jgi:hypothetical protein
MRSMSDQTLIWLILAGVVAFAGLLLWFRDRFRDLRHISEAERKLSERRNAEGAGVFMSFFYAIMFAIRGIQIPTFVPRIYYFLGASLCVRVCFQRFRRYQALRATSSAPKHLANHDGGAT